MRPGGNRGWKQGEIVSLTSLRGIAALAVAAMHVTQSAVLARQYLWVDFFFLLSGFILCHAYGKSFDGALTRRAVAKFLRARFFRVYPMHLATLGVLVAVELTKLAAERSGGGVHHSAFQPPFSLSTLWLNLLLIQNWGLTSDIFTWNMPSWSISTEAAAYLLFPFLLVFGLRDARLRLVLICLAGAALYWHWQHEKSLGQPSLLRCICEFWLGMALYRSGALPLGARARSILQFIMLAAVAVLLLTQLPDILIVPCFGFLIALCGSDAGLLPKMLQVSALRFLGLISYSLYMTHMVVLLVCEAIDTHFLHSDVLHAGSASTQIPVALGLLALVIGISALTHRTIELPFRKFGSRRGAPTVTDAP